MTYDIQLSPHFRLSEFVNSDIASAMGIDNSLASAGNGLSAQQVISNLQYLCTQCLEPLRLFANRSAPDERTMPIVINSGYRCTALNMAVGGAYNSNHLYGYAADIRVPSNVTGINWFNWMRDHLRFDELIMERSSTNAPTFWIHIAIRQDRVNRQRIVGNMIKK